MHASELAWSRSSGKRRAWLSIWPTTGSDSQPLGFIIRYVQPNDS